MNSVSPVEKARRATRTLTVVGWLWLAWTLLLIAVNQVFEVSTVNLMMAATFFVCGMGLATALWLQTALRQDRQWLVVVNEGEDTYVITARNAMVACEMVACDYRERHPDKERYQTSAANLDVALTKWDPEKLKRMLDGAHVIPEWWTR